MLCCIVRLCVSMQGTVRFLDWEWQRGTHYDKVKKVTDVK